MYLLIPLLLVACQSSVALPQAPRTAASAPATFGVDMQVELDVVVGNSNGKGGGLAVLSTAPGSILDACASGELFRSGPPMTPAATFEIASISKTFTSACVMLLVEQGVLDLDAPISTYLPSAYTTGLLVINGHDFGPELTLRQMLSHTSGLPDYWLDGPKFLGMNDFLWDFITRGADYFWTPEEIMTYVPDLNPIGVPGWGWHYSDSNYVLTGLLLQEVYGKELHDIYRELIYEPLGLTQTWLLWYEDAPAGVVESHRYEGSTHIYIQPRQSADWAGGGLVSSSRDLERLLLGIANSEKGDGSGLFAHSSTYAEMTQWVPTGEPGLQYGLGLFRENLGNDRHGNPMGWVWGHYGYGESWALYWPKQNALLTGALNQTTNRCWPFIQDSADDFLN